MPRWLNLRQLGREFDLTGPALGKHLDALGLREAGRPSSRAVEMGIGRLLPSSAHQEHPVVQWHAAKAIAELRRAGLVPVDTFAVFCRAAADKVHTHLLVLSRADDDDDISRPEKWWITGQLEGHLKKVPGNRHEEFIEALVENIRARSRKVPDALVMDLLGAVGKREEYEARTMARQIEQATPEPQARSTGPARRL